MSAARRTLVCSLRASRSLSAAGPSRAAALVRPAAAAVSFGTLPPPPGAGLKPTELGPDASPASTPPPTGYTASGWRTAAYAKDPIAWAVLLALLGASALGAYALDYYALYKTWPTEVRKPLKLAQKALDKGDFVRAERYFDEALNVARSRSPSLPLLHTTGLASILAHVQADQQRAPQRAIPILLVALADIDAAGESALTAGERLRRLGLLNKLAELAERTGDVTAEEKYAGRAVTEVLRASAAQRRALGEKAKADGRGSSAAGAAKQAPGEDDPGLDDLLPEWLDRTQVGATVDRLAGLYLRQGKADYAAPLYLHAINIVLPPDAASASAASVEEQCRAAMMMSNLSSTLSLKPTSTNLAAAKTWAVKSLDTIERVLVTNPEFSIGAAAAQDADRGTDPTVPGQGAMGHKAMCESVRSVALFNLGLLAEMAGDATEARKQLEAAQKWSADVGFADGLQEAAGALERLAAADATARPASTKG